MESRINEVRALEQDWSQNPRWKGVKRSYSAEDVVRLRGSLRVEHTLAKRGAEKLWSMTRERPFVNSLGALTGNQAVQQVKAGVPAIYLSGWQVAADANDSLQMYPDQSLYAVSSVPTVVRRINNALARADQIQWMEAANGKATAGSIDYFAPIVADAESGFGGVLNAYELMRSMVEAGAAGVHYEDQLASVKKCGHMGGKVLVPTQEAVQKLIAARLAADVLGVPTVLLARTDAEAADLVTTDVDENDKPHITGERTSEGFYRTRKGFDQALSRGLAYAEYADMVWCETGTPDLGFARKFAEGIRKKYPEKMLAYNCSPSFNWKRNLDDAAIARFQRELGAMGYKFQFITLAGFHALNYSMFELAYGYARDNMSAFVELQQKEFAAAEKGFTAVKHQREVGT
ncbi:MAG TPA: isocitrate lyase, partial [Burkholderiales bacterium]|nr:isocitrate lyase [Burkholderiales bacterium]